MTETTGPILSGDYNLDNICRSLEQHLERCFWVEDNQMSPFSRWCDETADSDEILLRHHVDVPECRSTSVNCWRPGTIPNFCAGTASDEWSYFYAIDADEIEVKKRAARVRDYVGDLSPKFFAEFESLVDLFMMHVDGWWEIYSRHTVWLVLLKRELPNCFERSSRFAGHSPT